MPIPALADRSAEVVFRGFESYRRRYRVLTRRARTRFETQDWAGMGKDATERLDLYKRTVAAVEYDLRNTLGADIENHYLWANMHGAFAQRNSLRDDWELGETFFNSITRRIFDTVGVDEEIEFVASGIKTPPPGPVVRVFEGVGTVPELFASILEAYTFDLPYRDLRADAETLAARVKAHLRQQEAVGHVDRLELIESVFFRDRRAYLVGRIYCGAYTSPVAIALANDDGELVVDAFLLTEDAVSILFSFTRSYFLVVADRPYDLVRFLKSLLPRKRVAELYIALGFNKHGKTELYRDLLRHLAQAERDNPDDRFVRAPGQRGMVMTVFTMPSYDYVFKLIKDRFDPPKTVTHQGVKDAYALVFRRERAGRLVDAQAFEHLEFDRAHFDAVLLDELLDEAGHVVSVDGDCVRIGLAYTERRVTPLDLYVRRALDDTDTGLSLADAEMAVVDYGWCIKDLAKTGIFPGDLLLKNFGVTRHGRVVFYDYDELQLMGTVNFRTKPVPRTLEQEMASEPWYSVGEDDVFPEELIYGLGLVGPLRRTFLAEHADLFTPEFWQAAQAHLAEGDLVQPLPFTAQHRLRRAPVTDEPVAAASS
ncbi:MAG: bifunctional isocitrate dehydrogenase kinase/phosphatase [Bacteroidota bacterium]